MAEEMTSQTFEFTGEVKLTYDENSPEFQEALESYREVMNSDGDAEAMLQYVAGALSQWGDHEHMVEGVGYVVLEGSDIPKENYSGIQVAQGYDERHFD
jgi:hypothetical protein